MTERKTCIESAAEALSKEEMTGAGNKRSGKTKT